MPALLSDQPGCLGAIFKLLGGRVRPHSEGALAGSIETLPYRLRDDFFSSAELSFYRVLTQVVADKAVVCPKVRIADILFVAHPNQNRSYLNRINQKHVDFVICDPASMRPLGVIELDDASHGRSDRQSRDELVDRAFEAARLPLLHLPVHRAYSTATLEGLLAPILSRHMESSRLASPPAAANESPVPTCPKCDLPMVIRTVKRGDKQGQRFWGCPSYPRCRETRSDKKSD